jgi:NAD(P)-dependent dehydrogenase (short-subunit alcohol dehydrogenase family)
MSSVVGRVVLPPNAAYAATKWALEALVEALAIEMAPLGLEVALLEPGAVSSGALDDVDWFRLPGDPYAHLGTAPTERRTLITPEEVAAATVDAVEAEHLPLRIPVGAPAKALLAARHAAPEGVPFVP